MKPQDSLPRLIGRREFLGLGAGLIAAGAISGLAGCRSAEPLSVAINPWPGFAFVPVALEQGLITRKQVRLVNTNSVAESVRLLSEHRVDAATLTLDEVLNFKRKGVDLEVVMLFDVSVGADVLLARPTINTLAELKGKRIGVETSTLGELMLKKSLESAGLKRGDVVVVPMQGDHESAWKKLEMDAIITYEPTSSVLESAGATRLFDSRQIPDTILDVLAVRSEVAGRHADGIRALVKAALIAQKNWKTNPVEASYQLSQVLGVPAEDVSRQFRGLHLPDLDYNRHILAEPAAELHKTVGELEQLLGGPQASSAPVRLSFNPGYLPDKI